MTFISRKTQKQLQDKLTTLMNKLTSTVFSDSCKQTLNKLACASYTPPCDGTKMKTLCKYRCSLLFDDCPEAFNFTEVSSYCAEPAQGDTTSGFCELTRWPSARHWDKGSCASLQISVKFQGLLLFAVLIITASLVSRRSLLPCCPREFWELSGRDSVTSQPTEEYRVDRAEYAQGLG